MATEKQPTRGEIKDAILRSGYLLETRIEELLREQWGFVEANSVYLDSITGKTRELDIYTLRADKAGPDEYDFLFTSLLIECINNPYPLICFTKEPLMEFLHHENVKLAGLPTKILEAAIPKKKSESDSTEKEDEETWLQLGDYLGMEDYHHYCKGQIATQYCSVAPKKSKSKKEWVALHEGNHFDSFRKLMEVTEYHTKKIYDDWYFIDEKENLNLTFYYPVLVVQGELLEATPTTRSVSLRKSEHVQFQCSAIFNNRETEFQIDIVQEKYFKKYLDQIEKETMKTVRLLRRRHKVIRTSMDRIIELAKKEESPERIRSAFEF
ncbi:MAG: hypothetical protein ACFFDP_08790 [Promethearchaeota archaeon]